MNRKFDNWPDLSLVLKGEKVKCTECNKGYWVAVHPEAKKPHDFVCTYCGERIHVVYKDEIVE